MTLNSSTDTPDTAAAEKRRLLGLTDLALIAAFAALTCVVTIAFEIPVPGLSVPITLQTFAIMLAGCTLGPLRGFLAASLYLALGFAGLPVFANHSSGLGVLVGPSAGYIIAFPIAAFVAGYLVKYVAGPRRKSNPIWVFVCSFVGSMLVIHPLGILGIAIFAHISLADAFQADIVFWPGDLIKTTLVALVASQVHRAFPKLLHPR